MKIAINLIVGITLVLFSTKFYSQQNPMFTQYMFNTLAVNPAYAGSGKAMNVTGLYRNQWVGLDGAPTTQTFFLHTPFLNKNMGLGLSVVNDKIGPVQQTMIYADYSYTIKLSEKAKLAFGLKGGVKLVNVNLRSLDVKDEQDVSFSQNITNQAIPNFGFGMYYHTKKWYVGISTPQLAEHRSSNVLWPERRHYFLIAGYVFDINKNVKFKPTMLTKLVEGAPLSVDLSANFLLHNKVWLGVAHRLKESVSGIIQYHINNQFKIGYSYDFSTSKLSSYNSGSHELLMSYDINLSKEKRVSPRFF